MSPCRAGSIARYGRKIFYLKMQRFYQPHMSNGKYITAVGPIKTFNLRGIKDSPSLYARRQAADTGGHGRVFQRILTDFNLTQQEKEALVAFMR